jgi:hypothetical protein
MAILQAFGQERNIAMQVDLESVDFSARKVHIALKAMNLEQVPVQMGTTSVRMRYDHTLFSNPSITFTGNVFPHTVSEQFSPAVQAVVTSYGILALSGGHQVLQPNTQWVTFGRFTLDMDASVGPQTPLVITLERGPGLSATPTVAQEFVTMFEQPNLNIIEFQDLDAVLSNLTSATVQQRMSVGISTYPSPAVNGFTLRLNMDNFLGYAYQLYDVSGQMVEKGIVTQKETYIRLDYSGLYAVQLIDADGRMLAVQQIICAK